MPSFTPNLAEKPSGRYSWRSLFYRYGEIGIIAGFWVIVALLTIAQQAFDPRYAGRDSWTNDEALFTLVKYVIWIVLTPGIFLLIRWLTRLGSVWLQLILHCLTGVAVSAVIHFFYHLLWNALVPHDPQVLSLAYVFSGLHFLPEFFLYLVVLAAGFARDYFFRYRERLRENARLNAEATELRAQAAELQAQLADARLRALQMQINPHFLFNTLHTIYAYLERDPPGARRIITLLSELLRYSLEKTDVKEVPLKEELGFLNRYLEIQTIRFCDRLTVHREIEPEVLDAMVPGLILQPLVENAIKHGISGLESDGRIELRAWLESGKLHLTVRDNGPGLATLTGDGAPAKTSGIGLQNTRNRLASLYRQEHSLIVRNHENGGAEAHLTLPFHTAGDLYTQVPEQ